MGFYIRKSLSVGPFRFNLSKSGIGLSTGIKGFRVGTGPRGNYVQMGRGGIYFRQTLPSSVNQSQRNPEQAPEEQTSTINFQEIESGNVSQMVDSSSAALLEEINSKSKKSLIWPWVLGLTICLLGALAVASSPTWIYCVFVPLCVGGLVWAAHMDKIRKTVVLFYELEPHIEEAYQNLHDTFDRFRSCSQVWHIESRGDITTDYGKKVNAGASALIRRKPSNPYAGSPDYFKSNISIPVLPAGGRTLYFLPDRILVWDSNGVGAVGFEQLKLDLFESRFIESGNVPSDAKIVGKTWRYLNKSGGPDKRFNDNREIPIALYEEILFTSNSGLRELFQTSRLGIGIQIKAAVGKMSDAISQRNNPAGEADSSEEIYIKCPCNNCEVMIEFPARGVGQTIVCPHCKLETALFRPPA
jgi:hypothetical protein